MDTICLTRTPAAATFRVGSTTRASVAHTVTIDRAARRTTCTCEAGRFGRWCRHADCALGALVRDDARSFCAVASVARISARSAQALAALVAARADLAVATAAGPRRDARERLARAGHWLDVTGDALAADPAGLASAA